MLRLHRPFDRLRRSKECHVTHFAARARVDFAVEVDVSLGVGAEEGRPVGFAGSPSVAEDVEHHGRAKRMRGTKREAADGADVLLELARGSGFDGPVA